MRKIILNPRIGPNGSSAIDFKHDWIVIRENDNVEELKAFRLEEDYRNFTESQLKVIRTVNHVLEENERVALTDEEADYLIFPFGREVKIETSDLQALAGFEVRKEVVQK